MKGLCYAGEVEEDDKEELGHTHCVSDRDDERFWDEVLAYLHFGQSPEDEAQAARIRR